MLKNIVTCFFILSFTSLFAQIDSKDTLLDTIAKESCECINTKITDLKEAELSKIELEYGLCVMASLGKYKTLADTYLNVSFNDNASMVKLGEDVALKMLPYCPDVLMVFAESYDETEDYVVDYLETYGEFTKIKTEQFNVVYFKDNNNREQKMLWFGYFEGSNLLSDTKALKGQKLYIVYEEMELFDPNIDDYRNFKVLQKIEKVE